jgi:hypothetical protein
MRRRFGKFANCASFIALISIVLSFLGLLGFAQLARADGEQSTLANLNKSRNPHPQFDDADLAMLREYAQQIGADQPKLVSIKESNSPHPQFDDADLAAVREYAQQIGLDQPNSTGALPLKVAESKTGLDALRKFRRIDLNQNVLHLYANECILVSRARNHREK